ncbi:hypothetical protein [Salsipaludibacter albus]|uniref:hypothetical protein n=1 Tax=Salsipaludibacter albus TaxID=2849650 RepID=UPI001EE3EC16|nr:hypothetical protein [Salsipaludibacter albus]MBY5161443.1 hypothetical protein [Salsipaludibacter albus]
MSDQATPGTGPGGPDDPDGQQTGRRWREDAESALDDVGSALSAAWEGSREARVAALDAAKGALAHLGTAIDQASRAARDTWGDEQPTPSTTDDTVVARTEPVEPPPPPAEPPAQPPAAPPST